MKLYKELKPYIIITIVVVIIRSFIVTPIIVEGSSMDSTLKDNEILLLNKMDKIYDRFEIIVFKESNSKLIKRVIGLPGETVIYKDGLLYINDELVEDKFSYLTPDYSLNIKVPTDMYFVLGDNRNNSIDSRIIGPINKKDIVGTVDYSLIPIKKIN